MGNRLLRFQTAPTVVLGFALLWVPGPAHAQSTATQSTATQDRPAQDRQASQNNDEITRRDLARFDQFLDSHREDAEQLRKTPSLIDDPQYLQNHPQLNAYLQDHPSVKEEITQRPDTFMRLEDQYNHDRDLRDRDANWQDRDANGQDRDRDANSQDRDRDPGARDRDADRRELGDFNRFLDSHREVGEQIRKDPSLANNREFVQSHPALQDFLRDNPGVREQLRQDPNAFMHQEDRYEHDRDADNRDRDGYVREGDRKELADFDHFLDRYREIAEQVRKDPSLADNREFVQNHPALQDFLRDNPGVREQLRQDPNAFMRQEDRLDHAGNGGDHGDMHEHMADFGGFLGGHSDINRDLSEDPSVVKDHAYLENHAELNDYLNAHPGVRDDLNANPQGFVKGAQQFGTNGTSTNGSASGTTAPPAPKPKQ
jgi:hypothetical protein